MANNWFRNDLPPELFNPRPELAVRPTILVRRGVFIASTAFLTFLRPPPNAGLFGTEHAIYVFYICLAILFVLGIGLILLGWFVADAQGGYDALARNVIRASQVMVVLAIALCKVYTNS